MTKMLSMFFRYYIHSLWKKNVALLLNTLKLPLSMNAFEIFEEIGSVIPEKGFLNVVNVYSLFQNVLSDP